MTTPCFTASHNLAQIINVDGNEHQNDVIKHWIGLMSDILAVILLQMYYKWTSATQLVILEPA